MRSLIREPIKKRITVLMSNHSTKHYDGVPPNWKHELCDMGTSHSRCFLALFWTGFTINQASADEHAPVRNFNLKKSTSIIIQDRALISAEIKINNFTKRRFKTSVLSYSRIYSPWCLMLSNKVMV